MKYLLLSNEHAEMTTDGGVKGRVKLYPLKYTEDCIDLSYEKNIDTEVFGKKKCVYECYSIRAPSVLSMIPEAAY